MKNARLRFARVTFLFLMSFCSKAWAQHSYLGILEDVPGTYAGEPNARAVRVVFEKDGSAWKALPSNCPDQSCLKMILLSYPREVNWTVAFDGRNLGRITGKTPSEFKFYSHVGLQQISSQGSIPTIGKRAEEYGGFLGTAVYRPLITNSQPYFRDPDGWKPAQLPWQLIGVLRQQFRLRFSNLCKVSEADETKLLPFAYQDKDIKLIKAYASKSGWVLARLHLEEAIDCKDVEAGSGIGDSWFVVDPQKNVKYLDQGMCLVDAGDYDNDGKSEIVFSLAGYNRGGYEMFYDDFKKWTRFEFSYH